MPPTTRDSGSATSLRGAASRAGSGRARIKRVERSRWRRQIRARPRLRGAYRVGVGVAGVAIMLIALSIGWLPGPGGVPLFLVGLAVLATEFVWAARLLWRANFEAHRFGRWSARQPPAIKAAMIAGVALGVCVGLWILLLVFGLPGWAPDVLLGLPGVRR